MNDMPDIPACLDLRGLTPEQRKERANWWKGRRLTVQGSGFRRVDVAAEKLRKQLQREYDRQQAEKRAARFKHLRENY